MVKLGANRRRVRLSKGPSETWVLAKTAARWMMGWRGTDATSGRDFQDVDFVVPGFHLLSSSLLRSNVFSVTCWLHRCRQFPLQDMLCEAQLEGTA